MTKQIQAYFKNEDDAVSAKTKLIGYKTEHLEVSALGDQIHTGRNLLLPIAPVNTVGSINTGGAAGATGIPTVAYAGPVYETKVDNETVDREEESPRKLIDQDDPPMIVSTDDFEAGEFEGLDFVLSAKVQDKDYDDIVYKLRCEGGYVEKFDEA